MCVVAVLMMLKFGNECLIVAMWGIISSTLLMGCSCSGSMVITLLPQKEGIDLMYDAGTDTMFPATSYSIVGSPKVPDQLRSIIHWGHFFIEHF